HRCCRSGRSVCRVHVSWSDRCRLSVLIRVPQIGFRPTLWRSSEKGCAVKGLPHDGTDMSHRARLVKYSDVSTALALLNDHQLDRLVDKAQAIGAGIGGTSALLDIAGAPVFVKRIPLTDLERHPQNVMSTANVFGLPTFCQYGVVAYGGPGFGAWREVAA